ncbi:MAG: thymidylate kinase [Firmicutes bacterium]|nr:thymidylate kinase [Bacillota bacterium]
MGKIIVFEGLDGSGKETQHRLLKERLIKEGYKLFLLDFPQYKSESSYFVRQYLAGKYNKLACGVSAKQASLCYAMDRFDIFKSNEEVKEALKNPEVILLANRYTTSNILFQAAKADLKEEIYELIDWICHLEYEILQIPKPDMVIMPFVEINKNIEILLQRDIEKNAQKNKMKQDIHEKDYEYLRLVSEKSQLIAQKMKFFVINCMDEFNELRTRENIHEEIYSLVKKRILK